ncbi:MAG: transcriptional regulator NrdR [Planctomycetota bacterium]
MRCPFCKENNDKVIDSRESTDAFVIRRRRECLACGRRITTYERIEETPLRVVKKDGSRTPFERRRILIGLMKACEKRPVSADILEDITAKIEEHISERYDREVPSRVIGNLIMRELRKVDQVAYVRFASVYRDFKDVEDFEQVAGELRRKKPTKASAKKKAKKKAAKKKGGRKPRKDGDAPAS